MEIKLTGNPPLVKLPNKIDLTLFLIREELKNKKFTNDLEKIGFDLTFFSSDFSRIICSQIGLHNLTEEFYEWYDNKINDFCKEINLSDGLKLTEEAFNFYVILMVKKNN
jgi:hypothetical protein